MRRIVRFTLALCCCACSSPPPCESNQTFAAACATIQAALQARCTGTTPPDCAVILGGCSPDGGTPDSSQRICSPEVSRCADAVSAAADCATAQSVATSSATCPVTCYTP